MVKRAEGGPLGNAKARTHGLYSVKAHGSVALPEALRGRELEIIGNLATHEGVMLELEHQALYQALVCETGFAHLRSIVDSGRNPWQSGKEGAPEPILRHLGSWCNGLVRSLAQLASLRKDKDGKAFDYEAYLARGKEDSE